MPKAFISVDLEGLPHIVLPSQLRPGGALYGEAREIATRLTNAVLEVLVDQGFSVVVADAHGDMVNIDPTRLRRGARLVRGFPRPLSMLTGARGTQLAILLGYHARAGVLSVLSHTYTGSIARVAVNDEPASEYLLNSMLLGEWGIPVALVAGSAKLGEEVAKWTPWAVWVVLKNDTGYFSAESPPLEEAEEELRKATEEALERYRGNKLRPLKPPREIRLCIEFTAPFYTELPAQIPGVSRINDTTLCTKTDTMEQAYKVFEAIAFLAWATKQMITQTK